MATQQVLNLLPCLGEASHDKESQRQMVGLSFTFDHGSEHFVLTRARRGCFCAECSSRISAATRRLREVLLHDYGDGFSIAGEWDVFYHTIPDVLEDEVLKSLSDDIDFDSDNA